MKRGIFKSRLFSALICLVMLVGMMPAAAFAEGTEVAWIGETGYETLEDAVNHAVIGDTIILGEGKYTLYGKGADTKGKNLTFVGQGTDKTEWGIGATIPDPDKFGTEYNGDYSFDGAGTVTFKNMTLQSGTVDYLGFIRADNTVVENCAINGKTFYWGYKTATFKNTTFNCPNGDYALWTYSSPVMTFDNCTFNSSGKVMNVYTDCIGNFNCDFIINFSNCTVNGSTPEGNKDKAVMNINDSLMGDYKFIINISGNNTINGVTPDDLNKEYSKEQKDVTCSRLFEFNTKYGAANTGRTVVSIDGIKVWENGGMAAHEIDGKMVVHEIDTANDKYTDGYKDGAYDITYGEWEYNWADLTKTRTVTKVCKYCGYTVEEEERGYIHIAPVTPTEPAEPEEPEKPAEPADPEGVVDPVEPPEVVEPDTPVTPSESTDVEAVTDEEEEESPKTADSSDLIPWMILFAVSGLGVAGFGINGIRKRRTDM